MKVVKYNPSCDSNLKIVLLSSKARNVIPRVLLNPCPSFINDNAEASDAEDETEEFDDDEDPAVEKENIKNEEHVPDALPSDSGVARSVTESEVESEPSPVIDDNETGTARGWNGLLFGKEYPEEHDKKGLQIEIHVDKDLLLSFCDSRFRRPAVGSVLEASDYGWDAVALAIVVNAIHGQYQYVPCHIDLDLFVKIEVIADRMECAEILHMAGRVWCANLDDHKAVNKLDSTTLMWLYVSWVFSLQKVSKSTRRLFAMSYQGLSG
ncbi:putative galactose oxidase precursor [Fusarium sp. NRRL 25303]|nr:putative galactose oxidase precursor [Fusarium sp. NRRL 25303]